MHSLSLLTQSKCQTRRSYWSISFLTPILFTVILFCLFRFGLVMLGVLGVDRSIGVVVVGHQRVKVSDIVEHQLPLLNRFLL